MIITTYSRDRLYATFTKWGVSRDFADPMINYLVYGYEPGSCFTAVLANDFGAAILSSHPSNSIEAFKTLVGWMRSHLPPRAYGSYQQVRAWVELDPVERRAILEHNRLIYTAREETWLALKGEKELA